MNTIEKIIQLTIQAALAFIAVLFAVRLFTGCALIKNAAPKEKIVEAIKVAYAEGGKEAASNKIEKLVMSGDLSPKQAAKLHEIAQGLYDRVVEKLEEEINSGCVDCKVE